MEVYITALLPLSTAVITHKPPHATGPAAGSAPPKPCTIDMPYELPIIYASRAPQNACKLEQSVTGTRVQSILSARYYTFMYTRYAIYTY